LKHSVIVSAALYSAVSRLCTTVDRLSVSVGDRVLVCPLMAQRDRSMVKPTSDRLTAQCDRPISQVRHNYCRSLETGSL